MYWGKIIGGCFGLLTGHLLGMFVGILLGHFVDLALNSQFNQRPDPGDAQAAFFSATFTVMGHVAKADGRVSEAEIAAARHIMAQLNLTEAMKRTAIGLFTQGKQPDFNLEQVLQQLRVACKGNLQLLKFFMEIQIQAALADGSLAPAEVQLLHRIGAPLGFNTLMVDKLIVWVQAEARFHQRWQQSNQQRHHKAHQQGSHQGGSHHRDGGNWHRSVDQADLAEAYAVLSVSPQAKPAEIKRAYRKLMSQHHPDKLVSQGLPPHMQDAAKAKTQDIQAAYDLIRRHRNFK